jgi:hypothetical protein
LKSHPIKNQSGTILKMTTHKTFNTVLELK